MRQVLQPSIKLRPFFWSKLPAHKDNIWSRVQPPFPELEKGQMTALEQLFAQTATTITPGRKKGSTDGRFSFCSIQLSDMFDPSAFRQRIFCILLGMSNSKVHSLLESNRVIAVTQNLTCIILESQQGLFWAQGDCEPYSWTYLAWPNGSMQFD